MVHKYVATVEHTYVATVVHKYVATVATYLCSYFGA